MVFLDTNVFVYAAAPSAYRDGAAAVIEALGAGAVGATTSAAVIEELWHLELSRRLPGMAGVTEAAYTLVRPVLPVTDEIVAAALEARLPDALGANDRIHIATCWTAGIRTVLTADRAFDGVPGLTRVDPADLPGVRRLLDEGGRR